MQEKYSFSVEGDYLKELVNKKWRLEKLKADKAEFTFLGVVHHNEVFDILPEKWEEIKKLIEEHDIILLEATPSKWFNYLKSQNDNSFLFLVSNPGIEFYAKIEEYCNLRNKQIYSFDPNNPSVGNKVVDVEMMTMLIKAVMLILSSVVTAKYLRRAKMKRRDFLKAGLTSVMSLPTLVSWLRQLLFQVPLTEKIEKIRREIPQEFIYDFQDFRDTVLAKEIVETLKKNPGKKVLVIYGSDHLDSVKRLLKKGEKFINLKFKTYLPYKLYLE